MKKKNVDVKKFILLESLKSKRGTIDFVFRSLEFKTSFNLNHFFVFLINAK